MTEIKRIQQAERDIPKLCKLAESTVKISKTIYQGLTLPAQDCYFIRMGVIFLTKQCEHMNAILVLTEHQQGRDASLIARSMIEGLAQLYWADEDRQTRAERWYFFDRVLRWRAMRTLLGNGETIAPEKCTEIEQELAKYGDQFLTEEGKRRRQEGRDMCGKCNVRKWWNPPIQIKQLIEEVLNNQFAMEYEQLSKWHHWNPVGFISNNAIVWNGADITYLKPSPVASARSLEIGFQCLLRTALTVDNCSSLGRYSELEELNQNYLQEISKNS